MKPLYTSPLTSNYTNLLKELHISEDNIRNHTLPSQTSCSFNKTTGNLVVPPEKLPAQRKILSKFLAGENVGTDDFTLLKPLLFDAAFRTDKAHAYTGLHSAIATNNKRAAKALIDDATPQQLTLGNPPPLAYAIHHDMPSTAMYIIQKPGISDSELLMHYTDPHHPTSSSSALRDALEKEKKSTDLYIKAENSRIVDLLLEKVPTLEMLDKFKDKKSLLGIVIEHGDEKRALYIVNKSFKALEEQELLPPEDKLIYLNKAKQFKDHKKNYAMPELVAAMEQYLHPDFLAALQTLRPQAQDMGRDSSWNSRAS